VRCKIWGVGVMVHNRKSLLLGMLFFWGFIANTVYAMVPRIGGRTLHQRGTSLLPRHFGRFYGALGISHGALQTKTPGVWERIKSFFYPIKQAVPHAPITREAMEKLALRNKLEKDLTVLGHDIEAAMREYVLGKKYVADMRDKWNKAVHRAERSRTLWGVGDPRTHNATTISQSDREAWVKANERVQAISGKLQNLSQAKRMLEISRSED
jgi:hypothetical protein